MSKVSGPVWLVSLAVMLVSLGAVPHAIQSAPAAASAAEQIGPAVMTIGPRVLAGAVALVAASLLLLLFFYRRRLYILGWTGGWALLAASMFIASLEYRVPELRNMAYGVSQCLGIFSALMFVVSADAYRSGLYCRRENMLALVPVFLWFALAPVVLGWPAVFAPGHLLMAGALAAAGIGHLLLMRQVRMLGAAVTGAGLLTLAGLNGWTALRLPSPDAPGATGLLITAIVLYLLTAGGMQLMAFEDMTFQLRRTNRRLETTQGRLRRMLITDPLTGCRNRRFFDEVIGRELQRHERYGVPLTLMFVDIDRFKAINDTFGHDAGDDVLRHVARFLLRHIREADYVFRWGGDEFLILLSCPESEARQRATELEAAFAETCASLPIDADVQLSIGCAEVRDEKSDVRALLRRADDRMYERKREPRRAAS